ncbi:MAG: hypothetical protein WCJ45_05755 [bacterium]
MSEDILEKLEDELLITYYDNEVHIIMKNLDGTQIGTQTRYVEPIIFNNKPLKSKTQAGSNV